MVKIKGKITPLAPTDTATISNVYDVVYCKSTISAKVLYYKEGKRETETRTVFNKLKSPDFIVYDSSGKAKILAENSEIVPFIEQNKYYEAGMPGNLSKWKQIKNLIPEGFLSKEEEVLEIEVEEEYLRAGDDVFILGFAENTYDEASGASIIVKSTELYPIIISDNVVNEDKISKFLRNRGLERIFVFGLIGVCFLICPIILWRKVLKKAPK